MTTDKLTWVRHLIIWVKAVWVWLIDICAELRYSRETFKEFSRWFCKWTQMTTFWKSLNDNNLCLIWLESSLFLLRAHVKLNPAIKTLSRHIRYLVKI
jgi:hypothetical protein